MASDLRQSKEWAEFLTSQGWVVEEIGRAKAYICKLPFYSSVIKIQRPSVMPPVKTIDKIAKKHRALFVKLEPAAANHKPFPPEADQPLAEAGFEPDKNPNLPTKTIIIDLTKSEKELWRDLSQDARQSIRKAESNQLSVISYQGSEIKEQLKKFHQLLKRTGHRNRFWTPDLDQLKAKVKTFGENAVLFLAYPSDQTIKQPAAGASILIHDGTAYGHHAAASDVGRELYAPYLLMWEIMKRTKDSGLKAFDLEGIYDPRYHKLTKSWQGFTVFKRKFGGREVEYPPPLIRYYHPVAKALFKFGSLSD